MEQDNSGELIRYYTRLCSKWSTPARQRVFANWGRRYLPNSTCFHVSDAILAFSSYNFFLLLARTNITKFLAVSSTSYMASGMAVRYVAVFHPDSYQSMTDRIEILSPDGSSSILCVQARNELPKLMCKNKIS